MQREHIEGLIASQRNFFSSNVTKSIAFRIEKLEKLKYILLNHEALILEALYADLGKPLFEGYVSEIYACITEINYAIKNLKKWMRKKKVASPWYIWPVKSAVTSEPHGLVLIIGTWNYPFNLTLMPLVGAIAAGNCVILKPSYKAAACQTVLAQLINLNFPRDYIHVVEGAEDVAEKLLAHRFNYIFLTGNAYFAKKVMHYAAEHLTPLTLELGGKSPCIIDDTASVDIAAKKITWAKWMNAGQTCIAPDYLLVHVSVKEELVARIKYYITLFYGQSPEHSANYARIINDEHMQRLKKLIEHTELLFGGKFDMNNRYFGPTLIEINDMKHPLMQEEIFGPILPIVSFTTLDEVLYIIRQHPDPLSIYLFSNNKEVQDVVLHETTSGSCGINEIMLQASSVYLPFGGVGNSGMGRYHGKASFDTFSYSRAIITKGFFELPIRYPHNLRIQHLLKKMLNYFS